MPAFRMRARCIQLQEETNSSPGQNWGSAPLPVNGGWDDNFELLLAYEHLKLLWVFSGVASAHDQLQTMTPFEKCERDYGV